MYVIQEWLKWVAVVLSPPEFSEGLAELGVVQVWILIRQLPARGLSPNHEGVHGSLDVRLALDRAAAPPAWAPGTSRNPSAPETPRPWCTPGTARPRAPASWSWAPRGCRVRLGMPARPSQTPPGTWSWTSRLDCTAAPRRTYPAPPSWWPLLLSDPRRSNPAASVRFPASEKFQTLLQSIREHRGALMERMTVSQTLRRFHARMKSRSSRGRSLVDTSPVISSDWLSTLHKIRSSDTFHSGKLFRVNSSKVGHFNCF